MTPKEFADKVHQGAVDEYLTRIDRTKLYPPFLYIIENLVVNLYRIGDDFWAIDGFRSRAEQDALYAQGRTKPGKIVTNARFGQSAHNYGIAADLCKDKFADRAGLQPDWNIESYKNLAEEAVKLKLEAGFYYTSPKDGPHVQLPISKYGLKTSDLKAIYDKGGIPAVWKELDKYNWS